MQLQLWWSKQWIRQKRFWLKDGWIRFICIIRNAAVQQSKMQQCPKNPAKPKTDHDYHNRLSMIFRIAYKLNKCNLRVVANNRLVHYQHTEIYNVRGESAKEQPIGAQYFTVHVVTYNKPVWIKYVFNSGVGIKGISTAASKI